MIADSRLPTMETMELPPNLDGSNGTNRAPVKYCQIKAKTDIEAIHSWLGEFDESEHTRRNYFREAERLLLWATHIKGVPLSSLDKDDILAYKEFVVAPSPAAIWIGAIRNTPRTSKDWRPFNGPLSPASRQQALVILGGLFSHLVAAGYLRMNPIALIKKKDSKVVKKAKSQERVLTHDAWEFLYKWLTDTNDELRKERALFIFTFLYLTGMRQAELISARMRDIKKSSGAWWARVTGKGSKERNIPVSDEGITALSRYRVAFGLPPLPRATENIPLIMPLNSSKKPLSPSALYTIITKELTAAAREAEAAGKNEIAAVLSSASTHWMRHTSFTHQVDSGVDLRFVKDNGGHTKLDTTLGYVHTDDIQRHKATTANLILPHK